MKDIATDAQKSLEDILNGLIAIETALRSASTEATFQKSFKCLQVAKNEVICTLNDLNEYTNFVNHKYEEYENEKQPINWSDYEQSSNSANSGWLQSIRRWLPLR